MFEENSSITYIDDNTSYKDKLILELKKRNINYESTMIIGGHVLPAFSVSFLNMESAKNAGFNSVEDFYAFKNDFNIEEMTDEAKFSNIESKLEETRIIRYQQKSGILSLLKEERFVFFDETGAPMWCSILLPYSQKRFMKKTEDVVTSTLFSVLTNLAIVALELNLDDETYDTIFGIDYVLEHIGNNGNIRDAVQTLFREFYHSTEEENFQDFMNFETVSARLSSNSFVETEYIDKKLGACRAILVPTSKDNQGVVNKAYFIIQWIESEKDKSNNITTHYKALVENTKLSLFEYFVKEKVIRISDKTREITNIKDDRILNDPHLFIQSFVHRDYRDDFEKLFKGLIHGKRTDSLTLKSVYGNYYKITISVARYDLKGDALLITGFSEDLTEFFEREEKSLALEQANKMIDLERRKLRDALLSQATYYYDYDLTLDNYNVDLSSDKANELLSAASFSYDQLYDACSKRFSFVLLNNDDLSFTNKQGLIDAFNNGKKMIEVEVYMASIKSYYRVVHLLSIDDDKHIHDFIYIINITKQKEIDNERLAALALANKNLQNQVSITKSLSDIYFFVATVNIPHNTYEVLHVDNSYFTEIEPAGKAWDLYRCLMYNQVKPLNINEFNDKFNVPLVTKALMTTKSYDYEFRGTLLDGKIIWCRIGAVLINKQDGIVDNILITFQNVTEIADSLSQLNADLKEAVIEANEASNAKTEFLSRMSHDIRTPMNAIIGFTDLAKNRTNDPEQLRDMLNKIDIASNQLLSLVNDVLDMNKIESGKITLDHSPFSVLETANNVLSLINENCIEDGITLHRSVNIVHDRVYGSPLHIKQIIINLLSNSVKYNVENGEIFTELNELSCDDSKVTYEVLVRDTGIGMSKEYLKELFNPFTQEESNGARTKYKGTGLGMSIVKKLVELMNGTIEVESEQGKGSKFRVVLTLDLDTNYQPIVEKKKEIDLTGKRILVVEDNELNQEIAKAILEANGIVVELSDNGLDAVHMFKINAEYYYDAILMDLRMPVMNGIDATKNIRALNRKDALEIPILAMTADAFTDDAIRCKEAGMNDHLAKPIDIKLLFETLNKYIK